MVVLVDGALEPEVPEDEPGVLANELILCVGDEFVPVNPGMVIFVETIETVGDTVDVTSVDGALVAHSTDPS